VATWPGAVITQRLSQSSVEGGDHQLKLVKLLTVPAVLLLSLLMVVPAFAHGLAKATIAVGCGTGETVGQVCVHIHGDNEDSNLERFLFFDLFATGSSTSLGEIVFHVKVGSITSDTTFDQTQCFHAVTNNPATSFVVRLVKVTSDAAGQVPSDFQFLAAGQTKPFIDFDGKSSKPVDVGTSGQCLIPTQPVSPPRTQSNPTPTPPTLAQTGGFDYRWPIAGLSLLVAGLTLLLVTGLRRRSADTGA
jgi:hypothetical protein